MFGTKVGFIYDIYWLCSGDINSRISGSPLDPGIQRTRPLFFLPSSRIDLLKGPHLIDPRDPATCLDVCGINRATPGDLCSRLVGMKRAETRKSKSFRHSGRPWLYDTPGGCHASTKDSEKSSFLMLPKSIGCEKLIWCSSCKLVYNVWLCTLCSWFYLLDMAYHSTVYIDLVSVKIV